MEIVFFTMIGILGLWFTEVHNSRKEIETVETFEHTESELRAMKRHGLRR